MAEGVPVAPEVQALLDDFTPEKIRQALNLGQGVKDLGRAVSDTYQRGVGGLAGADATPEDLQAGLAGVAGTTVGVMGGLPEGVDVDLGSARSNAAAKEGVGTGLMLGALVPGEPGAKLAQAGRGLYSRVDDALKLIPKKGAHPNRVLSMLKSGASQEELAYREVPEFLAQQGNKPVTVEALAAHLEAHPAPRPNVVKLGE